MLKLKSKPTEHETVILLCTTQKQKMVWSWLFLHLRFFTETFYFTEKQMTEPIKTYTRFCQNPTLMWVSVAFSFNFYTNCACPMKHMDTLIGKYRWKSLQGIYGSPLSPTRTHTHTVWRCFHQLSLFNTVKFPSNVIYPPTLTSRNSSLLHFGMWLKT